MKNQLLNSLMFHLPSFKIQGKEFTEMVSQIQLEPSYILADQVKLLHFKQLVDSIKSTFKLSAMGCFLVNRSTLISVSARTKI
jgi:predicted transcriptional regulator